MLKSAAYGKRTHSVAREHILTESLEEGERIVEERGADQDRQHFVEVA